SLEATTAPRNPSSGARGVLLEDCRCVHADRDNRDRRGCPSTVDLWHDLRPVSSRVRPDEDLSTPGLRERWDAGDYTPFHGWNKQAAQEHTAV
ncbi:MAG TPA: hypothetical protein VGH98_23945, partial [Gemmatimonadaceae bacterium]